MFLLGCTLHSTFCHIWTNASRSRMDNGEIVKKTHQLCVMTSTRLFVSLRPFSEMLEKNRVHLSRANFTQIWIKIHPAWTEISASYCNNQMINMEWCPEDYISDNHYKDQNRCASSTENIKYHNLKMVVVFE